MEKNYKINTFTFSQSKLDKISYKKTSEDTRIKIPYERLFKLPYSAIGLLKVEYPHKIISYRTGILITEKVILTAGHNLYDPRKNPNASNETLGEPINIEFYPGLSNNQSVFEKCEYEKYYSNYKGKRNEDYGIVILKESIGKKTGYFNLKIFEEKKDMNNIFYNCGYPLNKTTGDNNVFYQYEDKGKILELENSDVIVSGIKSSYGQSGAGLFFCKDNIFYVIGVHVASSFDDKLFYATMINKERFDQIQKWIKESNN